MSTMQADRIVDDYLRRLEAAAAHLQRSRRAELVAEIREHIEAALRQDDAASEVASATSSNASARPRRSSTPPSRLPASASSKSGRCSRSSSRSWAGS